MYDSFSRCSDNDKLSCTGRRSFHMDSLAYHGTDHFYSWKSFPCGWACSLYVRCGRFVLHSYQKCLILLSFILCLCFPAFAEDERYEFQDIRNEALYLAGYDLNEYYDNLEYEENLNKQIELYNNGINLLSANNYAVTNGDNSVISVKSVSASNNSKRIRVSGTGYAFTHSQSNIVYFYFDDPLNVSSRVFTTYPAYSYIQSNFDNEWPITITDVYLKNEDQSYSRFIVNYTFTTVGQVTEEIKTIMTAYLEQVGTVFTWILGEITELITFILGNPFLAVGLVLFMCGAVISFFIRIKNA